MRFKPTYSVEENTVDPNTDGNAMIDGKNTENPGFEEPKDFDLDVSPDIKGETFDPADTPDIREDTAEIDNTFDEADANVEAMKALDSIANEMYEVIATHGRLNEVELAVANESLKLYTGKPLEFSFENLDSRGMLYVGTDAAMEGITTGIMKLNAHVMLLLERLVRATGAQIKKITPAIDRELSRANTIKSAITSANREDGLKTVSGKFVNALSVDGQAPQGKTVVKTAEYLTTVLAETLSPKIQDQLVADVKGVAESVALLLNNNWEGTKKPSGYMTIAVFFAVAAGTAAAGAGILGLVFGEAVAAGKMIYDFVKTPQRLSLDPKTILPLAQMCPQTAKIRCTADTDGVHAYRTEPLFGGKVIGVIELNKEQIFDGKQTLAGSVPSLILRDEGKQVGTGGAEMQALTESEQRDTIESAINILSGIRQYYKNYPAKSKAYMDVVSGMFKHGKAVERVARGGGKGYAATIYRYNMVAYGRSMAKWVLGSQNKIAKYGVTTAGALVTLVAKSASNAQESTVGEDNFAGAFDEA